MSGRFSPVCGIFLPGGPLPVKHCPSSHRIGKPVCAVTARTRFVSLFAIQSFVFFVLGAWPVWLSDCL